MSGQTRPKILSLERIGDVFLNRLAALLPRDLHDLLGYLSSHRGLDQLPGLSVRGAVVDGLNVVAQAVPDMTVQIGVGMALAPTPGTTGVVPSPQTAPDSNYALLQKRLITVSQPIDPPPIGAFRWDLIELGPDAAEYVDDSMVVDLYDIPGKKFVPTAVPQPVMTHGEGKVFYTAGAPGGTIPAPTPGRVPLAAIIVYAGMAGGVTQERIFDARVLLSELVERGRADHASELDVTELAVDTSSDGTPAGVQKFSCQARATVRGVACGFATATPLDLNLGRDLFDFLDRNTRTRILTASGPDWLYCYLVATDDQGFRLSRTNTTALGGVPSGNRFSHAGSLLWSHVPPSLADGGSLAPSAPLALPESHGNGMVTPGLGRAVCIGTTFYGAATFRFVSGLRSFSGAGSFVVLTGMPLAIAPVITGEVVTSGVGFSSVRAPWPDSAPIGPLEYDVRFEFLAMNAVAAGADRNVFVFDHQPGIPYVDELRAIVNTTISSILTWSKIPIVVRGLKVGRVPAERAKKTGFYALFQVFYGTATGGSPANPTPAAHTAALLGYRWPNGPVIA